MVTDSIAQRRGRAGGWDWDEETAKYLEAVDALFPRNVLDARPNSFVLTLRFLPGSRSESQIVISKMADGGYAVSQYTLPKGSKTAYWQLMAMHSASKEKDATELAKQIKVNVRNVNIPSPIISRQVEEISELTLFPFDELDLDFARLDATQYQFWLERAGEPVGFYAFLRGDVYGEKSKQHPLVRWMNQTRDLIEKYVNSDQVPQTLRRE